MDRENITDLGKWEDRIDRAATNYALDFEAFVPEQILKFGYSSGGVTLYCANALVVYDVARYYVVRAPRSMALATNFFGQPLTVVFDKPVAGAWLSLIKDNQSHVLCKAYTAQGQDMGETKLYNEADSVGDYRTYFVKSPKAVHRIEFTAGAAWIARITGSAS